MTGPTTTTTPAAASAPGSTSSNACTWQSSRDGTGVRFRCATSLGFFAITAVPARTTDVLVFGSVGPVLFTGGPSPSSSPSPPMSGLSGFASSGCAVTSFVSSPYTADATADTSSAGSGPGARPA